MSSEFKLNVDAFDLPDSLKGKTNYQIIPGVGAGAWIPYKRGDDDVGWFISYSHS